MFPNDLEVAVRPEAMPLILGGLLLSCPVAARAACVPVYDGHNGWLLEACDSDPNVPATMALRVDGQGRGTVALVRVSHRSQSSDGVPQVAVLYASGYIRLKQNLDPPSPVPFGSSFVLGPGYWPNESTYYHHPVLDHLDITTARLPFGPLRLVAHGVNHDFDVSYEMTLPPPRDRQTRLHLTQH